LLLPSPQNGSILFFENYALFRANQKYLSMSGNTDALFNIRFGHQYTGFKNKRDAQNHKTYRLVFCPPVLLPSFMTFADLWQAASHVTFGCTSGLSLSKQYIAQLDGGILNNLKRTPGPVDTYLNPWSQ
jgi:hypothetical protein